MSQNDSFSRTLLAGLSRLGLGQLQHVTVHVAGATTAREGGSLQEAAHIFGPVVASLSSSPSSIDTALHASKITDTPTEARLTVWLVGPGMAALSELPVASTCCGNGLSIGVFAGPYHEFVTSPEWNVPSMVVAFNAGIWGYNSWKRSCECLWQLGVPTIITSYNVCEAEDDWDTLEEWGLVPNVWEPEENPNRSQHLEPVPRFDVALMDPELELPAESLPKYENGFWMCFQRKL